MHVDVENMSKTVCFRNLRKVNSFKISPQLIYPSVNVLLKLLSTNQIAQHNICDQPAAYKLALPCFLMLVCLNTLGTHDNFVPPPPYTAAVMSETL